MGKLYPVEQRHTEAAQRYFGYPLSPADAAHVIDAATHFTRFEAEHLTRIAAAPAVDREAAREAIARKLCEQHGGDPDAVAREEHDCWDGPLWTVFLKDADAIMALHPVKQSDGLAERVREACAALVEMRISLMGGLAPVARAAVLDALPLAIRSLDITRMDSDE